MLGPWHIDRVLAQGGMGTVYEASRADGQYEKKVALKCIRAEMSSPILVDAFMRERNHLAKLDHPNIIKVYEVFRTANKINMIMELCTGGELGEKLDTMPALPAPPPFPPRPRVG